MRVLIDCDGVIANFVDAFMDWYLHHAGSVPDDFEWANWDSMDELPDQMARDAVWRDPDLFWIPQPYPYAIEALEALNERHDVRIVTAVPHIHVEARSDWFKREAPFIHRKNQMIFTNDKSLIRAGVIIDDKVGHVDDWLVKNSWPDGEAFLIDRPWNQHGKSGTRVESLIEVAEDWL